MLSKSEPIAGMDPMIPEPYRVGSVREETDDIVTLELQALDGGTGYAFKPGQFNMLYVFGIGEVPISMSGDCASSLPIVHTVRVAGAVTRAICGLEPGSTVGVRGPFGTAWPVAEAEGYDVLVIAGGIGLAPLRPVVYHLLENRARYGRVALLYGARSPRELLYRSEVESWRGRFDLDVEATVDLASDDWRGRVGVVTTLIERAEFDPDNTVAMICGPEIMMRFSVRELQRQGVDSDDIYVSMERNMKCAIGFCGHCQYGASFVCKDGPVFPYSRIAALQEVREV